MIFSSLHFTFLFLPLVMILYFLAKDKYRNYILLVMSLLFYSYGEPRFICVMIVSIVGNYVIANWIEIKREKGAGIFARNLLLFNILMNIGVLFLFKYLDFSIGVFNLVFHTEFPILEIALPIGISFYTFQALSYVVDVYRGTVRVQKNPLYLALYISFFPQLIAGPIVRYSTIEEQITNRVCSLEKFAEGARRFMLGFSKKIILANNLSAVATEIFARDAVSTNPIILWLGSISFTLHIFYDFSGYSDMAIGLGKIFGFDFRENFDYPYISKSITEFWRRWHMSLGEWFKDYVYIPLGGSKVSVTRHLFNLFVVWILTGIWHGANYTFIAWGLGYFILLVIEKYFIMPEKRNSVIIGGVWRVFTLICVNFGWVIFNASGLRKGLQYCLAMVGGYRQEFEIDSTLIYYVREYGFFLIAGVIFSTPIVRYLETKTEHSKLSNIMAVAVPVCYGLIFLWATSFIILGAHNPFIYFNF